MDIIYLHDLAVECIVGIFDWERETLQTVYIDLDMGWDLREAARTENIEDTLSYKDVSKRISALVVEGQFLLVETMAEKIADVLIREFNVPWCRVRVNKHGAVRGAGDVGVIIERGLR